MTFTKSKIVFPEDSLHFKLDRTPQYFLFSQATVKKTWHLAWKLVCQMKTIWFYTVQHSAKTEESRDVIRIHNSCDC